MATDAQKNHIEVIVRGQTDAFGGEAQDTFTKLHYLRTPGVGTYNAVSFLAALVTKFNTEWLAAVSVGWTYTSIGARVLNDPKEVEVISPIGTPGGIAGDMLPADCCMLIHKSSALRGGNYRGQIFIAGVPEGGANGAAGNSLSAAQQVLLDALAVKLGQTVTAGGCTFTPGILSLTKSKLKMKDDPATVFMTPITAMTARTQITELKSRHSRMKAA